MVVGLIGKVVKKEPTVIHLNVSGVIYEVLISLNGSIAINGEELQLHISQIIREDAHLLYGFVDALEKLMFERLIKINGVGPKVAMAICSTFLPSSFSTIVNNGDVSALKRVPGIGPKSAGRIMVELSGFELSMVSNIDGESTPSMEAFAALESLGFKKDQIQKALQNSQGSDTATVVKSALKQLQKN